MSDKTKQLFATIGAVVLAGIYAMFHTGKVIDPTRWIEKFAAWGLPEWFVPVSGELASPHTHCLPKSNFSRPVR